MSAKESTELQEVIERLDRLEETVAFLIFLYLKKGGRKDGKSASIEFVSNPDNVYSRDWRDFKELVGEFGDVQKLINLLLGQ